MQQEHLKKLGRGWQYTVYDLGNGKVYKRWNTRLEAYKIMFVACFPYIRNPFWKFSEYYQASINTAKNSIRSLFAHSIGKEYFGNPKILDNGFDYEQDKLLPIDNYLAKVSQEEGKELINKFVEFTKFLIANRIIDKSFNIGKNFALDKANNIVVSDIGELYFTPELIQKQIEKKAWRAPYVLSPIPKKLRGYFIDRMEETLI